MFSPLTENVQVLGVIFRGFSAAAAKDVSQNDGQEYSDNDGDRQI